LEQRTVYVGLGSNLGDKVTNCLRALNKLSSPENSIQAVSSFYQTQPVGYSEQDWFVNCVARVISWLSPHSLLKSLKRIEDELGRVRTVRWGPRVIDLDILLCDTEVIKHSSLVVPHPRLHERQFVLVPLVELAPGVVHPILKKTAKELLRDIEGKGGEVEWYAAPPSRELLRCGFDH